MDDTGFLDWALRHLLLTGTVGGIFAIACFASVLCLIGKSDAVVVGELAELRPPQAGRG